jgi:hypothetical protein
LNDKNLITNKIQLGLRRLPSDDGERNNQLKIDKREVGDTGEEVRLGVIVRGM